MHEWNRRAPRRKTIGLAFAVAILLLHAPFARAADKIIGGSIGGQAPLWPIYIAIHKGFAAAQGLDLELNFAQSPAAVTQQLTAGSLDVALSVGSTDPLHAVDKGAALAIIRIVGQQPAYVLIAAPEIKGIADLKGKLISSGQITDIATAYLDRMLAANGVKKGEYDILPGGYAASRYAALRAGTVSAAMVLPPVNFRAAEAGYPTIGLAADYVHDLPFTDMAVYLPWARAHVPEVKRLLAATDQSIAWLADPAHRAEAIDLLVTVAQSSRRDAELSYDYLRRIAYFAPTSRVPRADLQNLIDVERSAGTIGNGLTVDRLILPGVTDLVE